jgi:two-component system, OmpR family, sensor histidine kinase VicK
VIEERIKKFLKMGANSSTLFLALIEDILDLSKIEAGTFALNVTSFMIPELLQDIYEIFEYQCKQKRLKLFVEIGPCLIEKQCKSDHGRIKQILLNLVSNALKFTFEGHIKIKAELIINRGIKYAQFSVSDTGMGIPKKEQKKLFKLFGMLDLNRNVNKNGWGIGLTISQKYAEALGGKIWLESEFKKGTSISFTIPYPGNSDLVEDSLELWPINERIFSANGFIKENSNNQSIMPLLNSKWENASRDKLSYWNRVPKFN